MTAIPFLLVFAFIYLSTTMLFSELQDIKDTLARMESDAEARHPERLGKMSKEHK